MNPSLVPSGERVVYLLHFDKPVEGQTHYVGITTPPRLSHRMREHLTGRGSARTGQSVLQGTGWWLANIWATHWTGLEAHMAAMAEFYHYCPVCRGRPGLAYHRVTKKPSRPHVTASDLLLDLTNAPARALPISRPEKGTAPEHRPPSIHFRQT